MKKIFSCVLLSAAMTAQGGLPATPLKDAAHGLFHMGVAINNAQIDGTDKIGDHLILEQFDSISPENVLKWEKVHPLPDRYDFGPSDGYVKFGEKHHLWIIGHTLMWHEQTPAWVFQNADGKDADKAVLLQRLRDHIHTVVGRYKGRVKGWDVVNEAIGSDGNLDVSRPWYRILGVDGIFAAFAAAHEADPEAELYYNEFNLSEPAKRAGAIKLVRAIRDHGLRIDGVGLQEHCTMDFPTLEGEEATVTDLAKAGFKVMITELDVTVLPNPDKVYTPDVAKRFEGNPKYNPYIAELPNEAQRALADRYAALFRIFAAHHDTVTRVTLWSVCDGDSWLNGWPIAGRTDYPTLFDRQHQPKPAFFAVEKVLSEAKR